MVIVKLEIAHFGKLKDRVITLRPGMNVITGENDSGKSTIAAFMKSMIFGAGEDSDIRKYEPYEEDGVFGGKMRILISGAFYTVERSFVKGKETLQIVKDADDTVVPDPEAFLQEAMNRMTAEEYSETGYAMQYFFLQDIQQLKETPEKRQALTVEKRIMHRIRSAKEAVLRDYGEESEKLKTADAEKADTIRSELQEVTEKTDRLSEEYPELIRYLQKMQESYQNDRRRLNEDRQKAEETLREDMLERKKELETQLKEDGGKLRKNVMGIILMTLSLLLAVATYFYLCSERISMDSGMLFYAVIGAFAAAFILFVTGIVLTAVRASANAKILKNAERTDYLRKSAEDAEERYQSYLRAREEDPETRTGGEPDDQKIRDLSKQAEEMQTELTDYAARRDELKEMSRQMEASLGEQDQIHRRVEAMKLALEAFEDAEAGERANEAFSKAASEYLNRLDPRKESRIFADGGFISVEDGTTEVSLEQLSLSGAVEVLLAARLARLDEKDTKKCVPMILDDVLAGLDSERVTSNMSVLRSLGRQVILLSCQQRERKAL